MRSLRVLVTGCGAPGIQGTIFSLKNNSDGRKIEIIGTDIEDEVIGKYLCDRYYKIPGAADTQNYLEALFSISNKEKVDVIIPQNTSELSILASSKQDFKQAGTSITVSDEDAIKIANNKYELMKICNEINVPAGSFCLVNTFDELVKYATDLGWPRNRVVVKPPVSNGLRGVRIIDEHIDLKKAFYSEKPNNLNVKMKDLKRILGHEFPDLIVTEYLTGDEYTVDLLRTSKDSVAIPRKRDLIRSGITFNGTTEYNEKLIEYSKRLSNKIGLEFCFGFQFKLDENGVPKILESNPRVQGTMVLATFAGANIIYGAVKSALEEEIPEFDVKWGIKIFRYWGGISVDNKQVLSSL